MCYFKEKHHVIEALYNHKKKTFYQEMHKKKSIKKKNRVTMRRKKTVKNLRKWCKAW